MKKIKRALISVSDKKNLKPLLSLLKKFKIEIISSGGTYKENKRNDKSHYRDLINNNYDNIDLVIVNFYPFEETLKNTSNHKKIIENIDVGGPTMVRAAAKNYNDVAVITSSSQY